MNGYSEWKWGVQTRYGRVHVSFDPSNDWYTLKVVDGQYGGVEAIINEEDVHRSPLDPRVQIEIALRDEIDRRDRRERHRKAAEDNRKARAESQADAGANTDEDDAANRSEDAPEDSGESVAPALAGWRGWNVDGCDLVAYFHRSCSWSLEGVSEAECMKISWYGAGATHPAPNPSCTCGWWAYRTYELMEQYGPILTVYGVVALGGIVEEHDYGYRAQKARIVALLDSPEAQAFKAAYEAPVEGSYIEVYAEQRGVVGRVPSGDGRPARVLPVPILSREECEKLAELDGCAFEADPPPVQAAEMGQYLVPAGGITNKYDDEPPASVGFIFAPTYRPPYGSMRVDHLLGSQEPVLEVLFMGEPVKLVRYEVGDPIHGKLVMWRLGRGRAELVTAMTKTIECYGNEWLAQYRRDFKT